MNPDRVRYVSAVGYDKVFVIPSLRELQEEKKHVHHAFGFYGYRLQEEINASLRILCFEPVPASQRLVRLPIERYIIVCIDCVHGAYSQIRLIAAL